MRRTDMKNADIKQAIKDNIGQPTVVTISKVVGIRSVKVVVQGKPSADIKELRKEAIKLYDHAGKDVREDHRPGEIA